MARKDKKDKPLALKQRCLRPEDPGTAGPERDLCQLCGAYKDAKKPFMLAEVPKQWTGTLMVVGERPGADEDQKTGRPFTGKSGQLLRQMLKDVGFTEPDVIFTNGTRCGHPKNATPTVQQIRCCRPFLLHEIQQYNPQRVIGVGVRAGIALTNEGQFSITKKRGRLLEVPGVEQR